MVHTGLSLDVPSTEEPSLPVQCTVTASNLPRHYSLYSLHHILGLAPLLSTQGLDGGRWSDLLARENCPLPVTGRVVARGASVSRLSLSSVMGTSVSHETCLMEQLEKRDSFPGPRPRKPDLEMPGTLGRQQPWEFLPGSATAAASCPVSPKWPTAVHPANNLDVAGSPPGVALHTHKRGCARAVLGKQWNLRGS